MREHIVVRLVPEVAYRDTEVVLGSVGERGCGRKRRDQKGAKKARQKRRDQKGARNKGRDKKGAQFRRGVIFRDSPTKIRKSSSGQSANV